MDIRQAARIIALWHMMKINPMHKLSKNYVVYVSVVLGANCATSQQRLMDGLAWFPKAE